MFVKNLRDCEEFIANDGCRIRELVHSRNDPVALPYSLALARVQPGKRSYRHRLQQSELYYILTGRGEMHVDGDSRQVEAGAAVLIDPGQVQWIENHGDEELRFLAIVNPPWTEEGDERLE